VDHGWPVVILHENTEEDVDGSDITIPGRFPQIYRAFVVDNGERRERERGEREREREREREKEKETTEGRCARKLFRAGVRGVGARRLDWPSLPNPGEN